MRSGEGVLQRDISVESALWKDFCVWMRENVCESAEFDIDLKMEWNVMDGSLMK